MIAVNGWTTKKIKEVIENSFCCSESGVDFEHMREELTDEYYRRLNKLDEKNNKRTVMRASRIISDRQKLKS
jgi:hypothetical protein